MCSSKPAPRPPRCRPPEPVRQRAQRRHAVLLLRLQERGQAAHGAAALVGRLCVDQNGGGPRQLRPQLRRHLRRGEGGVGEQQQRSAVQWALGCLTCSASCDGGPACPAAAVHAALAAREQQLPQAARPAAQGPAPATVHGRSQAPHALPSKSTCDSGSASSAPNTSTAASALSRAPSHVSRHASGSGTNRRYRASQSSTASPYGWVMPVRYRKSADWRYG